LHTVALMAKKSIFVHQMGVKFWNLVKKSSHPTAKHYQRVTWKHLQTFVNGRPFVTRDNVEANKETPSFIYYIELHKDGYYQNTSCLAKTFYIYFPLSFYNIDHPYFFIL
jgi:hypothetical protein